MKIKAYAKINLTLEIVGKESGFHLLESIVVPINIYDTLRFEKHHEDIVVSNQDIKNNNIYKAIKLFKEKYQIDEFVKVTLDKQIPIGYGLGGSSADISATLKGLNKLFNLKAPKKKLELLANSLGSDTLFCLYNKRAFIFGRGDKIRFLPKTENFKFLIIYPEANLLTKDVFNAYSISKKEKYLGFSNRDFEFILANMKNDLLNPAIMINNNLKELYERLIKNNINVNLTGSGPALFVVNPTALEIKKVKNLLNNKVKYQITEEIS